MSTNQVVSEQLEGAQHPAKPVCMI